MSSDGGGGGSEGRKLSDLRVVDLKYELEKRGLDKNGVKKDLVERLQKALENNGHDPETFVFESGTESGTKKPPKRLSTSSSQQSDDKTETETGDGGSRQEEDAESEAAAAAAPVPVSGNQLTDIKEKKTIEGNQEDSNDEDSDKKIEQEEGINLTLDDEDNIKDENPEDLSENVENNHETDYDAPKDSAEVHEAKDSTTATTCTTTPTTSATTTTTTSTTASQEEIKKHEEGATATVNNSGANASSSEESPPKKNQASNPRLLWIANVPKNTRANELKQLLSTYGKVVCAKVVVNARFPGSCCFGYVTMGSVEDALNVIAKLNNTEFNGQIIKIDKFENVKADSLNQRKSKEESKDEKVAKKCAIGEDKERAGGADRENDEKDKRSVRSSQEPSPERRKSRTSDRSSRAGGVKRGTTSRDRELRIRERQPVVAPHHHHRPTPYYRGNVLTFNKIKEERERQRMRDRERAMREDSRRRHEEALRLREMREISRRQRSEAERLEREREKLRIERDKIEREKSELIKLERERQRIEREKLEMEKMELQRSRLRLEEDRRTAVKRPAATGTLSYRRSGGGGGGGGGGDDSFEHDRKRPAPERHFDEPPSLAPRFEPPGDVPSKKFGGGVKEFKRGGNMGGGGPGGGGSGGGYDKHEGFQDKRGRDYGTDRPPLSRGGGGAVKYDRSYETAREREPPSRESQSNVAGIRSKESRYGGERGVDRNSPHYRAMSDSGGGGGGGRGRHAGQQGKSDRDHHHHHYMESNKISASDRWNHPVGAPQPKSFISSTQKTWSSKGGGGGGGGGPSSWRPAPPTNVDRWNPNSATSRSSMSQSSFSSNSNVGGPACPPPPGINNYSDRFEYNKTSNLRKY